MQAIFEPLFSITYLISVVTLGLVMFKANSSKFFNKFGIMAIGIMVTF